MNPRFAVALLTLTFATAFPAWADDLISPLPLAREAMTKPAPWPSEARKARHNAEETRFSALVGTRDFEALEQETQRWSEELKSGKLSMDGYMERLSTLSGAAHKSTLPDIEAWVAAKPKSYAAVFSLGLAQFNVAFEERGKGWAKDVTQEQWASYARYTQLAHKNFLRSLTLTDKPVPSYRQLARLWGMGALERPRASSGVAQSLAEAIGGLVIGLVRGDYNKTGKPTAPNCQSLLQQKEISAETSPEPLYYYTCLAMRDDPEASIALKPVIELNSIRWSGNWNRSKDFLDQLEKSHAVSDKVLRWARSEWYTTVGYDSGGILNDKRGAAEAYMASIELWPVREAQEHKFNWAGDAYQAVSDFDNEIKVYQKATAMFPELGHYWAALGFAYEHKGDMRNYTINMSKAALLGDRVAQNNVGYSYMTGQRGLPKDLHAARDWLTLAANQGFQHSKDKLPIVNKMIQDSAK